VLVRPGAETNLKLRFGANWPPAQPCWNQGKRCALGMFRWPERSRTIRRSIAGKRLVHAAAGRATRAVQPDTQDGNSGADAGLRPARLVSDAKGYIWFNGKLRGKNRRLFDPKSSW